MVGLPAGWGEQQKAGFAEQPAECGASGGDRHAQRQGDHHHHHHHHDRHAQCQGDGVNDDHDHEYDDDPFLDQMAAKDKEIEDLKRRVIEVHRARAKVFLTLSSHWALTTG